MILTCILFIQSALRNGPYSARGRREWRSFQGILASHRCHCVLCLEGTSGSLCGCFHCFLRGQISWNIIISMFCTLLSLITCGLIQMYNCWSPEEFLDCITCVQGMPEFVFANRAGLEMFETKSGSLQDLAWEKTLDENDRKVSYATFTQVLQQVCSQ